MSTKITTPILIDLPGETLPSENTGGVILPKGTTNERPGSFSVDFLVIAGGGGGGGNRGAGGGGAGGYRTSFGSGNISGGLQPVETALSLFTNTSYNVTVGEGGAGVTGSSANRGGDGSDSIFDQITSTGGGGGGGGLGSQAPGNGGSGGGASNYAGSFYTGGTAVTPTQGFDAGDGNALGATSNQEGGVGGGGAGSTSLAVSTLGVGTNGGSGLSSSITGSPVLRAGGGGGASNLSSGSAGTGSDGGGNGRGKSEGTGDAQNGTPNTGGGGGAHPNQTISGSSGSGGSGVVILRYSDEYTIVETTSVLTFTTDSTSVPNTKITTFTQGTNGIIQFTTSSAPQPSTGEFRYNTTDKYVEFYNGTTWKQIADEYISGQPSTCVCNFPTTGTSLFQFEDNLNDTCGNYNITSSNNITYDSSGKFGKAADFASSYADIPYTTFGEASCSISFWLYPHTTSGQHYFMTKYQNAAGYGILMQIYSNSWYFNYYNTATGQYAPNLSGYSSASPNTWYHVVMTHELNTSVTYYINNQTNIGGTSSTFTSLSGSPSVNSAPLRLGWYWTGSGYWDGLIDQVRIFDSCLTASQVSELYNEVPCT